MKKYKFDLERALAGEPIINGKGEEVLGFHKRKDKSMLSTFPYADIAGITYTEKGGFFDAGIETKDLYMKYPPLPPEGTYILVRDDDKESWRKKIFLYKDTRGRILVVGNYCEDNYFTGYLYEVTSWKQWKPIEEPEIEITVKINGKESKLSDISDETLKKLKALE